MADHQAMLSVVDPSYIVMIQGVPSMYGGMIERIGATTTLERDGKPPIPAQQGVAQLFDKNGAPMEAPARGAGPAAGGDAGGGSAAGRVGRGAPVKDDGSTATLIFGFPKNDPISAADKEVEFSTTIGAYHVKRKFRVKDMLINGEPAL